MKRKRQQRESTAQSDSSTVASPDTDVENFGPWLRQQREVREIDRREVADASKISVRYIEALETNRFEVLPAEVFTKGFLRQYAAYVGLDPEEVVNYYLAALQAQKGEQEADSDLKPRPRSSRSTNAKWLLAAMVVAGILISVVWLLFRMSNASGADPAAGTAEPAAGVAAADTTPPASRSSESRRSAKTSLDEGPADAIGSDTAGSSEPGATGENEVPAETASSPAEVPEPGGRGGAAEGGGGFFRGLLGRSDHRRQHKAGANAGARGVSQA